MPKGPMIKWSTLETELAKQLDMLQSDYPVPDDPKGLVDHYRIGLHAGFHVAMVAATIALSNDTSDRLAELVADGTDEVVAQDGNVTPIEEGIRNG